ncbi:MAG: hypothetical protein HY067_14885 [Betaproteobacteria bacterium]|nr:hypothetical protein [Betaproteobacteria bacterium]
MTEKTEEEKFLEAHQKERDVLFSNESFVIGVLQAVSGGSLFAALAQSETLLKLAGKLPFLTFLTLMGISLISAVFAAYWKHQYKMWDVKARVSGAGGNSAEMKIRSESSSTHLVAMRQAMFVAVIVFVFGLGNLLFFAWARALCPAVSA